MNILRKLKANKKGILNIVMGAIIAAIVASILVMIAAEINVNVYNSMPTVSGAANTTITNMYTATFGGLQLMTVLPVVLAAAAIIAAIVGGFMVMRSQQ